jgi:redox-sensitive bicupin YhaK (pirin superfamily)
MPSPSKIGKECRSADKNAPTLTTHPSRDTHLGKLSISRALPIRERRMVGPWCFLDRFGPLTFGDEQPMRVPPHPHIGLQTVSWLLEGEIRHTDSLGSEATLFPGGVNVMTAGRGIAHAEVTPPSNSGKLNGVQLWVALPDAHRHTSPAFTSIGQVPPLEEKSGVIQLFAGTYQGIPSPAPYFSPILGMDVQIHANQTLNLQLDPQFEHALFILEGDCGMKSQAFEQKILYYLGNCRESLKLSSQDGCRVLLIGGLPFPEKILMWWNFVARTPEEILQAREDWESNRRFGEVKNSGLDRLSSPTLSRFAAPNPVS